MNHQLSSFTSGKRLFLLVIILSAIGIIAVFEGSHIEAFARFNDRYYFVRQQLKWLGIGFFTLIGTSLVPSKLWRKVAPILYGVGIVLLVAVLIPQLGTEVNGARRWLAIGGLQFQPVELVKLGTVAFFSVWLIKHQRLGPFLTFTLLPVALLMLQPDLGSTLVVVSITFSLFIAAGGKVKNLAMLIGGGLLLLTILVVTSSYRRERLMTYLNPSSDPLGAGYHVRQITFALGNGGWLGVGIGQSKQKFQYLPEASTDSIFALVAEEIGFVGSTVLILLLIYFLHTCFQISQQLPDDSFERLFSIGLIAWIGSQMLINLAAIATLIPLTGIPLPFISRGGSSLLTIMLATGILISLSRTPTEKRRIRYK